MSKRALALVQEELDDAAWAGTIPENVYLRLCKHMKTAYEGVEAADEETRMSMFAEMASRDPAVISYSFDGICATDSEVMRLVIATGWDNDIEWWTELISHYLYAIVEEMHELDDDTIDIMQRFRELLEAIPVNTHETLCAQLDDQHKGIGALLNLCNYDDCVHSRCIKKFLVDILANVPRIIIPLKKIRKSNYLLKKYWCRLVWTARDCAPLIDPKLWDDVEFTRVVGTREKSSMYKNAARGPDDNSTSSDSHTSADDGEDHSAFRDRISALFAAVPPSERLNTPLLLGWNGM